MERIYNKLVRDNIPEIIKKNNEEPVTRILEDDEYKDELYQKLMEETKEVIGSQKEEDTLEELADVLEVVKAIAELNDKKLDDIIETANKKASKRGGFEKRIFLEKVIANEQ